MNVEVVGKKSEMYNYCGWRVCGYFQKLYELCSKCSERKKMPIYVSPQKGILWWAYTYILPFYLYDSFTISSILLLIALLIGNIAPAKLEDAEACSGGPSPAHLKGSSWKTKLLQKKKRQNMGVTCAFSFPLEIKIWGLT